MKWDDEAATCQAQLVLVVKLHGHWQRLTALVESEVEGKSRLRSASAGHSEAVPVRVALRGLPPF